VRFSPGGGVEGGGKAGSSRRGCPAPLGRGRLSLPPAALCGSPPGRDAEKCLSCPSGRGAVRSVWTSARSAFMSAGNGRRSTRKTCFFFFFFSFLTRGPIPLPEWKARCLFFAIHRTVFSQPLKMHSVICCRLSLP